MGAPAARLKQVGVSAQVHGNSPRRRAGCYQVISRGGRVTGKIAAQMRKERGIAQATFFPDFCPGYGGRHDRPTRDDPDVYPTRPALPFPVCTLIDSHPVGDSHRLSSSSVV